MGGLSEGLYVLDLDQHGVEPVSGLKQIASE